MVPPDNLVLVGSGGRSVLVTELVAVFYLVSAKVPD